MHAHVNTMIRTRGDRWIEGAAFKPDRAKDEREYNGVVDRAYAAEKWKERGAWQPDQVIDERTRPACMHARRRGHVCSTSSRVHACMHACR